MQAQRSDVFAIADHRDHLPPAALLAALHKFAQQRLPNADGSAHASRTYTESSTVKR